MRPTSFVQIALGLALMWVTSPSALAVDLQGGTHTFTFPETLSEGSASITVVNQTGDAICDFVIRVVDPAVVAPFVPPFNITSANVRDPNLAAEDWNVDDNENGQLEAGEADELPDPADIDEKVRLQEVGNDHCIPVGRSATIDLKFSAAPQKGSQIKISPTSSTGGVIFNVAMAGCASVYADDVLFATGRVRLTNTTAVAMTSIPVATDLGVSIETMRPLTMRGTYDHGTSTLLLDRPLASGRTMLIDYELSGFSGESSPTTVCFGGAQPVPIEF